MRALMAYRGEIDRILGTSAEKAAAIAEPILKDAMDIMGFWRVK
jgi:hypothetical protein